MKLFHYTKEGEPTKVGFNFYPPNDPSSIGFKLMFSRRHLIYLRWSKIRKKLHFNIRWMSKDQYEHSRALYEIYNTRVERH
jgi:hypothetical protein